MPILIEGPDEFVNSVAGDCVLETGVTVWIKIICPNEDISLSCWNRKGTYTCHDIAHCFSLLELFHESSMFGLQPCVPVHFRIVEPKVAIFFTDFNIHIVRSGEDFVLKSAILVLVSHVVNLIDHGFDHRIFVEEDLGDQVFVGYVRLAEVQVRDVTDYAEAARDFIVCVFG